MRITRTRRLMVAAAMAFTLLLQAGASVSAEDSKPAAKTFKDEELASLLAPIALYPDTVVAQILMASTYPLEVVEASRWVEKNAKLKGEALATEAKKQSWDQSVQALTALPDVLKQMDTKLDWTQKLGDAFLAQQADVMAMVQTLRGKAQAAGNLKSDEHLTVKVEPAAAAAAPATTPGAAPTAAASTSTASSSTQTIIIESADPQVIYVPTYSPTYAYGPWYYPSYPPYYFPYPPAYVPGAALWWGASVAIRVGFWSGAWNNNCNWGGGTINVNNVNIGNGNRTGNGNWNHNPEHRKGVSYRDNSTAKKYDRGSAGNASSRDAYRGRSNTGASAGTSDLGGRGGASAGTRDLGGAGGASAGTRDLGGRGGASASTRDLGGGSGGSSARAGNSSASKYGGSSNRSSSGSSRSSGSSAFSGMSSGSRASSFSSRGSMSRGGGGRRR